MNCKKMSVDSNCFLKTTHSVSAAEQIVERKVMLFCLTVSPNCQSFPFICFKCKFATLYHFYWQFNTCNWNNVYSKILISMRSLWTGIRHGSKKDKILMWSKEKKRKEKAFHSNWHFLRISYCSFFCCYCYEGPHQQTTAFFKGSA